MNTFEIKLTILTILGEKAKLDTAKELYEWVSEELELVEKDNNVTTLKTVQ
jgi:hypothetical protein